jgi:AcrR family transcriptional regulator
VGSQRNVQADERRRQILAIARQRFLDDGYAKTSVSSIVRGAGIAQGTFYLYFKSKQDVLVELRRGAVARYEAALLDVTTEPGPADLRLAQVVSRIVRVLRELMPLERVFRAAESAENTQRAALNGRKRLARLAARFIEQGITEGDFQPRPPLLTAQLIVTLFDSVLYDALAHQQPDTVEVVAEEGMRFALRALGVNEERLDVLCRQISFTEEGP